MLASLLLAQVIGRVGWQNLEKSFLIFPVKQIRVSGQQGTYIYYLLIYIYI